MHVTHEDAERGNLATSCLLRDSGPEHDKLNASKCQLGAGPNPGKMEESTEERPSNAYFIKTPGHCRVENRLEGEAAACLEQQWGLGAGSGGRDRKAAVGGFE